MSRTVTHENLSVSFLSRYRDENDYRVTDRVTRTEYRVTRGDDGETRICGDVAPIRYAAAVNAYLAAEHADFLAWKADFEKRHGPLTASTDFAEEPRP